MRSIILVGDAPDAIGDIVRGAWDIDGRGYIASYGGRSWISAPGGTQPEYALLQSLDADGLIRLRPALAVFCGHVLGGLGPDAGDWRLHAVVNSGDTAARGMLRGRGALVIACGHGSKDTVTFSSVESEGPVITIQRALEGLAGEKIEEQDIHIKRPVKAGQEYDMLAAVAVCAMTGALGGL